MLTPKELHEEWHDGETGLRPARIQAVREELREYTDRYVPRRIPEIESWLDTMQGQITKELNEAVSDEGDSDESGDGE